jgi:hypothetical protein
VNFKQPLIALGLTLSAAMVCASPDDEASTLTKRGSDRTSFSQLGEQMKTTAGEKTHLMLGKAMGMLGVPYRRGGTNEESGFDCSGFVRHLYETSIGRLLPRRADDQASVTDKIERSELSPGDLVFFNTMRRTFSHVGIYIGDGKFIHSPSAGKAVRVDDLREAYWKNRFTGARRVQDTSSQESVSR